MKNTHSASHDEKTRNHSGNSWWLWPFWARRPPFAPATSVPLKPPETLKDAETTKHPKEVEPTEIELIPNSYTIMLKETSDFSTHITWIKRLEDKYRSTPIKCELVHEYELINGYSVTLDTDALEEISSSADVEEILPNQVVRAASKGLSYSPPADKEVNGRGA
ncbi:hypothetical protein FRC07_014167 [Ceratobasidium sp. 392]|nr:hypothetical protein FRC07_014167 [Ceratobasidium sp. 392]